MEENDWEAIQMPNSGTTTTTQSDEDDGDVVVVATAANFNKPSVFPPSNHEGLPVTPPPPSPQDHHFSEPTPATSSPPSSYSSSLTPSSSGVDESVLPCQPEAESTGVKARLGILSSGVLRIAYGIRNRIGIWSIAWVAAIAVVAVYGRRWQRWRRRVQKESRDQMVLLINQKDEKIKQLLIQIDQMNEILSTRRRVPVHRIMVDRPLINKRRSNWKPT